MQTHVARIMTSPPLSFLIYPINPRIPNYRHPSRYFTVRLLYDQFSLPPHVLVFLQAFLHTLYRRPIVTTISHLSAVASVPTEWVQVYVSTRHVAMIL
jgi:hypothetical protein